MTDTDRAIREYLGTLSQRIRGLRAGRGMTRRQLAVHSEMSERYLAQLEAGKANPSVSLLWRIAAALGVGFEQLVGQATAAPDLLPALWTRLQVLSMRDQRALLAQLAAGFDNGPGEKTSVALIGLRGAGKTTLGKTLAARLAVDFVRLTERIETLAGMDVGELVSLGGQAAFRRLERQALEATIAAREPMVLEVGGSLVSEPETFQRLRGAFVTVWLQASPREHMDRVIRQGDMRPMQGNNRQAMSDLLNILAERESEYAKADFSLDTSGRSPDACLDELVKLAGNAIDGLRSPA